MRLSDVAGAFREAACPQIYVPRLGADREAAYLEIDVDLSCPLTDVDVERLTKALEKKSQDLAEELDIFVSDLKGFGIWRMDYDTEYGGWTMIAPETHSFFPDIQERRGAHELSEMDYSQLEEQAAHMIEMMEHGQVVYRLLKRLSKSLKNTSKHIAVMKSFKKLQQHIDLALIQSGVCSYASVHELVAPHCDNFPWVLNCRIIALDEHTDLLSHKFHVLRSELQQRQGSWTSSAHVTTPDEISEMKTQAEQISKMLHRGDHLRRCLCDIMDWYLLACRNQNQTTSEQLDKSCSAVEDMEVQMLRKRSLSCPDLERGNLSRMPEFPLRILPVLEVPCRNQNETTSEQLDESCSAVEDMEVQMMRKRSLSCPGLEMGNLSRMPEFPSHILPVLEEARLALEQFDKLCSAIKDMEVQMIQEVRSCMPELPWHVLRVLEEACRKGKVKQSVSTLPPQGAQQCEEALAKMRAPEKEMGLPSAIQGCDLLACTPFCVNDLNSPTDGWLAAKYDGDFSQIDHEEFRNELTRHIKGMTREGMAELSGCAFKVHGASVPDEFVRVELFDGSIWVVISVSIIGTFALAGAVIGGAAAAGSAAAVAAGAAATGTGLSLLLAGFLAAISPGKLLGALIGLLAGAAAGSIPAAAVAGLTYAIGNWPVQGVHIHCEVM